MMKITQNSGPQAPSGVRRTGATGAATYKKIDQSSAQERSIADVISITSIPAEELTPNVHKAISQLVGEVDRLRRDLDNANIRLRELEDLADLDTLLPIPNRRAFLRELNRMISFAERYGTPSTLMFIDMNDLKVINDNLGHEAGDKALRHLAVTLSDNLRGTDMLARLGGDEFGVLLAQADETTGPAKAAQLAQLVADTPVMLNDHPLHLQFAYGTYTFGAQDNADHALEQADQAMYVQKRIMKGDAAR